MQSLVITAHAAVTYFFLAQVGADIRQQAFLKALDGGNHVDFHQEVDPATQVETQVHGLGIERAQPFGRGRSQVKRDQVLLAQAFFQGAGRLQLGFGIIETHQQVTLDNTARLKGYLLFLQGLLDQQPVLVGQRLGAVTDLNRGIFTVQVRQCIDAGKQQNDDEQDIFPQRVLIQHG